jgi:C1A family cysteine protease
MMRHLWFVILVGFSSVASAAKYHPIMHYSKAQWQKVQADRTALIAKDRSVEANSSVPNTVNLTSYLGMTPTQRDQGQCGNCWAWASTGAQEIALTLAGANVPLSVEYINAAYPDTTGSQACCAGSTTDFVEWYNAYSNSIFVPLVNANADFVDGTYNDGNDNCGITNVNWSSISTTPHESYSRFIENYRINTFNTTQQAIALIEQSLANNVPVIYAFQLNSAGWSADNGSGSFFDFWDNYTESDVWNPSQFQSGPDDGGHVVLIVGYDGNGNWIVQNSWGMSENRPNGQFLMSQNINYNAELTGAVIGNWFETTTITFADVSVPLSITSQPQSATVMAGQPATFTVTVANGIPPYTYQWYSNMPNSPGSFFPIADSNGVMLLLVDVQDSNAGSYYVTVTDSGGGKINSDTATLTVTNPSSGGCSSCAGSWFAVLVVLLIGAWVFRKHK